MSQYSSSRTGSTTSLQSLCSLSTVESEPDKIPQSLQGPMVWKGSNMSSDQYVTTLSNKEVESVRAAVVHFKLLGRPRGEIGQKTFPLPSDLADKLGRVGREAHTGVGFGVLRGLGKARFNDEESVIAFAGVASYVCSDRATDPYANQTLSHVRDATHEVVPDYAKDIGLAASKLPTAMEFHCDRFSGDILSLYVKSKGSENSGGEQYLASFWTIYNELLAKHPETIEVLAKEDWPFEVKRAEGELPQMDYGPILFFEDQKPIVQLVKAPLLGSPKIHRSADAPKLTAAQEKALEIVEKIAKETSIELDRADGDIQFINNLGIMHARAAYVPRATGKTQNRHLLRMFLRDSELAWKKPTDFAERFDRAFELGRPQELPILDTDPWRKISGTESHG